MLKTLLTVTLLIKYLYIAYQYIFLLNNFHKDSQRESLILVNRYAFKYFTRPIVNTAVHGNTAVSENC